LIVHVKGLGWESSHRVCTKLWLRIAILLLSRKPTSQTWLHQCSTKWIVRYSVKLRAHHWLLLHHGIEWLLHRHLWHHRLICHVAHHRIRLLIWARLGLNRHSRHNFIKLTNWVIAYWFLLLCLLLHRCWLHLLRHILGGWLLYRFWWWSKVKQITYRSRLFLWIRIAISSINMSGIEHRVFNAFPWYKLFNFRPTFHCMISLKSLLQIVID
jgi:hypothetical protein